jgi:hypothetical protein
MAKRRPTPTLLIVIATLLSACQERPTAPAVPEVLDPQLAKGGNQGPAQTVTFIFANLEGDRIIGDGRIPPPPSVITTYTDGECGVGAAIPGYNGDAHLNTKNSKIGPSEEDCGGREGRYFEVNFDGARVDDGPRLDWDTESVQAKWMMIDNVRSIPKGDPLARLMTITFEDNSEHGVGGNGWGQACPGLLRFGWPGTESSLVQVERVQQQTDGDGVDEWLVVAAYPNDVAACLDADKGDFSLLGYYHVPFQLTLICEGEC